MEIIEIDINLIKPYESNPRKISQIAIDKVAASIQEFGWKQPIVVDKNNIIIVGHTRLLAAKKLGLNKVPIIIANDLSKENVKAYRLADNRTNQESEWDFDDLKLEFNDLKELDFDLSLTGFDDDEIKNLFNENININTNIDINEKYNILVELENEIEQEKAFELIKKYGYKCKVLSL